LLLPLLVAGLTISTPGVEVFKPSSLGHAFPFSLFGLRGFCSSLGFPLWRFESPNY